VKKLLAIIIFVAALAELRAQQLPHYSNYMLNNYPMNPAVGGSNSYFEGLSNNRYQWIGITDAPRTYMLSVNGPTRNKKMGLGGLLFTDIVGPTRRTGLYLSYAYHIKVAEKVRVSLGISAGILQFMVDGSKITLHDPKDNVISGGVEQTIIPDFGAGIYVYSTDKKWYVGASVPQIMQSRVKFYDYTYTGLSRLATHYYVTGGYKFDLGANFKIEPSACVKYVAPAPVQFDLGLRAIYKEKIWIGGAYRHLDAVSAMVGFVMQENITFAYAYDFTMTNIKKYSTGTHELMIGIKFHKTAESSSKAKIQ
jgi:type IX secretion system PorP/SprF family membrane protein